MSMLAPDGGASAGPVPSGEPALPGEPPEPVSSELLWRLATRLYRDHDPRPGGAECVICHQRWPCSGRRLAELGLIRAAS